MAVTNLSSREVQTRVQQLWATYGSILDGGVTPQELSTLRGLERQIASLEADLAADENAAKARRLVSPVSNPALSLRSRADDAQLNGELQLATRLGELRRRIELVSQGTPALALHVSTADANHDGRVTKAETSAFLGQLGLTQTDLAATLTLQGASHAKADEGEGLLLSRLAGQSADLFDKHGRVAMDNAAQWFTTNATGPRDSGGQPTITENDIQRFIRHSSTEADKGIQHTLRSAVAFNFLFGVSAVSRSAGEGRLVKAMTIGDLRSFARGDLFDSIIQRRTDARHAEPTTGLAAQQREDILADKNTLGLLDSALDATFQQHPGVGAGVAGGGVLLTGAAFLLNPVLGVGVGLAAAYPVFRGGWSALKGAFSSP